VADDPVEDGCELADSDVPLPSDRWRAPRADHDAGLDELYAMEALYYDDAEREHYLGLESIRHEEPTYLIRVVADKRKGRKGRNSSGAAYEVMPSDERLEAECEVEDDEHVCTCWSEMLAAEGWELCATEDDMLSVAESWVIMEEDEKLPD
jgi:hypothetical protein